MWALDAMVREHERRKWREHWGTEFTGMHEGRPVRLVWREPVIGHVCFASPLGDHAQCLRMYGPPRWVFERGKKP